MKTQTETDKLFQNYKRIHMIGIGGSGMCPLAEILHSKGYTLTGSDNNESDPLKRIRSLGIEVHLGHKAENIGNTELIVYSAAISQDNPELIYAKEKGIPMVERAFLLGALTRKYDRVIGVCGTHGKTTVTSMITQILFLENYDPTAVIGGKLPLIGGNGRAGNSEFMVCEACEFNDTFLKLSPDIAVLLNIDNDHMDYFKTMDNLKDSFKKFISMAGVAVFINGDDNSVMEVAEEVSTKRVKFGIEKDNDYSAENIASGKLGMEFDVIYGGIVLTHICLQVPGNHNIYNALAAFAVAHFIGIAPVQIKNALESFRGAGRRFEYLGTYKGITIADDYAHHPTEIRATLVAAKKLPYKRVVAVFQPFTFSRTALLLDEFISALSIADEVVLTPIMGSREINTYEIESEDIAKGLSNCVCVKDFNEVSEYIEKNAKEDDLIITMGGGDIYKAAHLTIANLKK